MKPDLGVFFQDTWTINRLTLNLGGRYDTFNAMVPAQSAPAGTWIQARDFAEIPNVPNWKDWSVRASPAPTTCSATARPRSRPTPASTSRLPPRAMRQLQPHELLHADARLGRLRRQQIDPGRAGNIQFNEVIGGTSNFGQITSRPDPELLRGYNWEYSTSVQHELMERVSVTVGYYRRNFYNLEVIDNLNLARDRLEPVRHHNADRSAAAAVRHADHHVYA